MPHPPILPPTETMTLQPTWGRRRWQWPVWGLGQWGHGLALGWAIAIGAAVVAQPNWVQALERQAQSLVLQLRPEVVPPANIVILAIDETSVSQLPQWPLPRQTYAQVIDRLMAAGAQAVSIDVLWDLPSSYGSATAAPDCDPKTASADDQALATVLARYSGRVTLAAHLERSDGRTGSQSTLQLPYCPLLAAQPRLGSINFLLEPSLNHLWTTNLQSNQQLDKQYQGPVHQLGSEFLQRQAQQSVESQEQLQETQMVSFAEATLMAARGDARSASARSGRAAQNTNPDIFFYGRSGRFPTISFADVVQNWNSDYLQKGRLFQGKIVLIGPTAPTIPDFLNTPMGSMAGVELHANAIATLMEGRALGPLLPNPWAAGGLVTLVGLGLAGLQMRLQRARDRGLAAGLGGSAWLGLGYGGLTLGGLWLPMALPVLMMGLMGASHLTIGLLSERRHKRRLRSTMKQYARSPLVQEIISQQDDRELSTLLQERDRELQGKVLGSRYKIIRILGSGGFGETYIAEDFQRPGQPQCVVKQLRPASDNPKHWQLARKLFKREAETLEQLGEHDQIPRLLAYFEETPDFYLVQEFIGGAPLSDELALGRQLPEAKVTMILRELLEILSFVHSRRVIHRDIKPSNIIQRARDGKLVLIDFGAVKAIQAVGEDDGLSDLTISIGTQGYMPSEQCAGNPRLNSDVYAVGMVGIQALTGLPPSQIKFDITSGELDWQHNIHASLGLIKVLDQMTRYDFNQRYPSAVAALEDLKQLSTFSTLPLLMDNVLHDASPIGEAELETRIWPRSNDVDLPPTQPPPDPV